MAIPMSILQTCQYQWQYQCQYFSMPISMAIPMSIVLPAQFQWQCQYQLFSLAIPMAMSISIPKNNTTNGNVNTFGSVAVISPKKPLAFKSGHAFSTCASRG